MLDMKVLLALLLLVVLLDDLIGSMLFIDSHPSVDQAMPAGTNLGGLFPSVRTLATAL